MKALITGGAGFIGYHLAKELLGRGYEIVLVDNFSRGVEDKLLKELESNPGLTCIAADLMAMEKVMDLGADYDYIYHLAAIIGVQNVLERPYEVLEKNALLLLNMIALAKKQQHLQRFVFASTSEIYAGTLQYFGMEIPTPESTPLAVTSLEHPRTSYMLSKIYGEALLQQSGLKFTVIRPHNFYGPRMGMSHVIPELLKKAYFLPADNQLEVFSAGHRRTFCYIDDAVIMIRMLAESEKAEGQAFNIGNEGPEVTMGHLAELVLEVTGSKCKIIAGAVAPGSPERRCPDMKKTYACIGYKGKVALEEGVGKTFEWYREHIFDGNEAGAK